jgi:hypothetical protein
MNHKANKEAGQKRPGIFAFTDPRPPLWNFTTLMSQNQEPSSREARGFLVCRSVTEPSVASALDIRLGATPRGRIQLNMHSSVSRSK